MTERKQISCERCGKKFDFCTYEDQRDSNLHFEVRIEVPNKEVCPACLVDLALKALMDFCRVHM